MTAQHKPGCPALGGYGHGKEPCACGAEEVTAAQESRAQFEEWALRCCYEIARFPGHTQYTSNTTEQAWLAWQASRAALSAEPVAVPKGWQLVPVEPTEAMLRAGWDAAGPRTAWPRMLAAAPQPAAQERTCDTPLYCLSVQRCTAMDEQRARGIAGQHST